MDDLEQLVESVRFYFRYIRQCKDLRGYAVEDRVEEVS